MAWGEGRDGPQKSRCVHPKLVPVLDLNGSYAAHIRYPLYLTVGTLGYLMEA